MTYNRISTEESLEYEARFMACLAETPTLGVIESFQRIPGKPVGVLTEEGDGWTTEHLSNAVKAMFVSGWAPALGFETEQQFVEDASIRNPHLADQFRPLLANQNDL